MQNKLISFKNNDKDHRDKPQYRKQGDEVDEHLSFVDSTKTGHLHLLVIICLPFSIESPLAIGQLIGRHSVVGSPLCRGVWLWIRGGLLDTLLILLTVELKHLLLLLDELLLTQLGCWCFLSVVYAGIHRCGALILKSSICGYLRCQLLC